MQTRNTTEQKAEPGSALRDRDADFLQQKAPEITACARPRGRQRVPGPLMHRSQGVPLTLPISARTDPPSLPAPRNALFSGDLTKKQLGLCLIPAAQLSARRLCHHPTARRVCPFPVGGRHGRASAARTPAAGTAGKAPAEAARLVTPRMASSLRASTYWILVTRQPAMTAMPHLPSSPRPWLTDPLHREPEGERPGETDLLPAPGLSGPHGPLSSSPACFSAATGLAPVTSAESSSPGSGAPASTQLPCSPPL